MTLDSKPPKGYLRVGFPYEKTLGMRRLTNTPVQVLEADDSGIRIFCRGEGPCFIRHLTQEDEDLGGINLIDGNNNVADGYKVDADFVWPSAVAYDPQGNISISDEGNNTYGGVYSWVNQDVCEAYRNGELYAGALANNPNFVNLSDKGFAVLEEPSKVTHMK